MSWLNSNTITPKLVTSFTETLSSSIISAFSSSYSGVYYE